MLPIVPIPIILRNRKNFHFMTKPMRFSSSNVVLAVPDVLRANNDTKAVTRLQSNTR